jgi:hypothetical protein
VFGGNGRRPKEPAPTQEHVPVELVKDGVIVSRPLQRGGRVVAAVLRVGSQDVTRMSEGERADFLERYAACLARWQFPYQVLVWRERQNPAEFLQRVREKQAAWGSSARRGWANHLRQLAGWVERVTVQVNPQVPAYFIALPHAVSRLLGQPYEKALAELESRCRTVIHGLATLGVGCVRLNDAEMLDLVAGFYHPSLPMLRIPPRQRLQSLMVRTEDGMAQDVSETATGRD